MRKGRVRSYSSAELTYNKAWNKLIQSLDAEAFYRHSDRNKADRFVENIEKFLVKALNDSKLREPYKIATREACQEIFDLYHRDYLGQQRRESDFFEESQSAASEDDVFEDDTSEDTESEGDESTVSETTSEGDFAKAESAMEVDAHSVLTAARCTFFKSPRELGLLPKVPARFDNLYAHCGPILTEEQVQWVETVLA